jgi:hypothetical protein
MAIFLSKLSTCGFVFIHMVILIGSVGRLLGLDLGRL